ncbi:camp-dependent protein kinase catalytic subunit [Chytridiales sp. JEL 0842]|nr:camp-dependent protein kinase catalytic subunit [Chytridiales sp. JEL 0842]
MVVPSAAPASPTPQQNLLATGGQDPRKSQVSLTPAIDVPASTRSQSVTSGTNDTFQSRSPGKSSQVPIQLSDVEMLGCIGRGSLSTVMLANLYLQLPVTTQPALRKAASLGNMSTASGVGANQVQAPVASSTAGTAASKPSPLLAAEPKTEESSEVPKKFKKPCAVKIMKKHDLMRIPDGVKRVFKERDILKKLSHPFIIKYFDCLQDSKRVCEVAVALEWLHSKKIVYRDLKVDNVLIHMDGHVRLCDFGSSTIIASASSTATAYVADHARAMSFTGTGVYMAPEVIIGVPYGKAVDWWGFGILIYEMLVGKAPFAESSGSHCALGPRTHPSTFLDILDAPIAMPTPPFGDSNLTDLVSKLLSRHPDRRLGSKGGLKEIRCHPWFKEIIWGDFEDGGRGLAPPVLDVDLVTGDSGSKMPILPSSSNNTNYSLTQAGKELKPSAGLRASVAATKSTLSIMGGAIADALVNRATSNTNLFVNIDEKIEDGEGEMGWLKPQGLFRFTTGGKCGAMRGRVSKKDDGGSWNGLLDLSLDAKLILGKDEKEREDDLFADW